MENKLVPIQPGDFVVVVSQYGGVYVYEAVKVTAAMFAYESGLRERRHNRAEVVFAGSQAMAEGLAATLKALVRELDNARAEAQRVYMERRAAAIAECSILADAQRPIKDSV